MKTTLDVAYGTCDAQRLDIYAPDGKTRAVFLYFHGGGMKKGDKSGASAYASYLVERGIALISANYRMYPEAKYPDFVVDAASCAAFAKKYASDELGCDKLYIGGISAGGYLSMMLCFDPGYLAAAGMDNSQIAGYLHGAGQPTAHFNVLAEKGIDPRRVIVDETSPLYHVGTAESYPPMRFIVSDNDMQNRYEQTMLILSTLKHFEYTNFDHIVMHGKHCSYTKEYDENGNNVFAMMINDFINHVESN